MKTINFVLANFAWVIVWLIPLYAFFHLIYFLIALPLRRQERARFLLDLVESGVRQGRSIEQTIAWLAESRDHSLGVRFHLLATCLKSGWDLVPALERASGLLPPQMMAMFKVGSETGDLSKALPACRTLLREASSQVRSSYNYLVVLAFVFIPITPALFWMMTVFVVPRLRSIVADVLEVADQQSLAWLPFFDAATTIAQAQILLALFFYVGAIFYVGGPRLIQWLQAGFAVPSLVGFFYWIPWRRKRMQRDFSPMLAVLLDAGVPEERAILLAADATDNELFAKRAAKVVASLRQGIGLAEAVGNLDQTSEFRWRLGNALQTGRNFMAALQGWRESLDATAFQQEQAAGQMITTFLVVLNGIMVGLFALFVFGGICMILEGAVSW